MTDDTKNEIMNPWLSSDLKDNNIVGEKLIIGFEDNFTVNVTDSLPDSQEYLQRLESKLHRLKSNTKVLQDLREKREDCMRQLLANRANINDDECLSLDDPINQETLTQQLKRNLCPERQALTVGELINITQHDYLEKNLEDQGDTETNK